MLTANSIFTLLPLFQKGGKYYFFINFITGRSDRIAWRKLTGGGEWGGVEEAESG